MKILVPIKRVVDPNVKVRVKADGTNVDLTNMKMAMNPFDEIALEAAVRLKEAGSASEVVAVSIGSSETQETLRTALAAGADRAILINTDKPAGEDIEPLAIAKLLAKVVEEEQPRLVICGKLAIDNDMSATGQMLAALLGWPQATFASALSVKEDTIEVRREIDSGLQMIEVPLPAVVTVDLRLNEPRYASLPAIMKAKKKPLETKSISEFSVDISPRLKVLKTAEPAQRTGGHKLASIDDLVLKIKQAGMVK